MILIKISFGSTTSSTVIYIIISCVFFPSMKQSQSAVTEKKFDDRYSGKSWINKTEGIHYPGRSNSKFTRTVLEKCLWTIAF